ncbi:MAG: hypothetical protein Q4F45_05515, partial [Alistipes sp.]|nr:hypothetical protein [Alistipes sp.]
LHLVVTAPAASSKERDVLNRTAQSWYPDKIKRTIKDFLGRSFILYFDIPSPTPPFKKGRGLVADIACSIWL